jgi:hypothetical protein
LRRALREMRAQLEQRSREREREHH